MIKLENKFHNKKLVKDLDYDRVGFPIREKDFSKIETENNICINVFCYENKPVFQSTFQIKILKTPLMVINHIMSMSMTLTDLCFTKHKIKIKNTFAKVAYSVLVVKLCRQTIK